MARDRRRRPGIWDDFQGSAPDLELSGQCPGIFHDVPGCRPTSADLRHIWRQRGNVPGSTTLSRDLERRPGICARSGDIGARSRDLARRPGIHGNFWGSEATFPDLQRRRGRYRRRSGGAARPRGCGLVPPRAPAGPNQVSSMVLIFLLPSRWRSATSITTSGIRKTCSPSSSRPRSAAYGASPPG